MDYYNNIRSHTIIAKKKKICRQYLNDLVKIGYNGVWIILPSKIFIYQITFISISIIYLLNTLAMLT